MTQTTPDIRRQIIEQLDTLSREDQERALAYVRALAQRGPGISGAELAGFFAQFGVTQDEAAEWARLVQEGRQENAGD
jgi:hypothetical protein